MSIKYMYKTSVVIYRCCIGNISINFLGSNLINSIFSSTPNLEMNRETSTCTCDSVTNGNYSVTIENVNGKNKINCNWLPSKTNQTET